MKATASCQTLSVSTPIIQSLRAIEDAIIECGDSENLTDIANRKVTLSEFDSIQQTIVSNDASNKETQTNLLNFKKKYEKILNDVHFV